MSLEEAEKDDQTAVVVVTGEGRAFSAGQDMNTMGSEDGAPSEFGRAPKDTTFGRCLWQVTSEVRRPPARR